MQLKHNLINSLLILNLLFCTANATANTKIQLLQTKDNKISSITRTKITQLISHYVDVNQYRIVKFQVMHNERHQIDHVVIYLFSKKYHRMDMMRMNLDAKLDASSVQTNYHLTSADYNEQPGIHAADAKCPDPSIEFIAFAPNDDMEEQNITNQVAFAAMGHSLKTVMLLKKDATRTNYLNYMTCPKLKGNFYNGDATFENIATVDGVISYADISSALKNAFRYKVTNIWLACQAYNRPLRTSVEDIAQSQKYAAGVTDLLVGPSDLTAACAMESAIDGFPMKDAFDKCYDEFDVREDWWGYSGDGSDIFGT